MSYGSAHTVKERDAKGEMEKGAHGIATQMDRKMDRKRQMNC